MGMFSLSRLAGAKPRLARSAVPALRSLAEEALAPPAVEPKTRTVKTKPVPSFKPALEGPNARNVYNVAVGERWGSLDPRRPRVVRILAVGATHAMVICDDTGARTTIALKRFSGRTRIGYARLASPAPSQAMVN